jgi:hypothetical protein
MAKKELSTTDEQYVRAAFMHIEDKQNIPRPSAAELDHARFQLLGRLKRLIEDINMGHQPGDIARLVDDLKALDGIKAAGIARDDKPTAS